MDDIKSLGLTDTETRVFENKTYRKIMARRLKLYPANIKEKTAERLNVAIDSPTIAALEWLGLFDDLFIPFDEGSNFDLLAERMLQKMMLPAGARDMVIMLHSFLIETADGKREVIKSRLLDYATKEATSIARTVALPAAIGVKMILDGEITDNGVQIPISKSIYQPILTELEKMGIAMVEEWGLPESEKLG
jgi:saccharopine dehydrogenase-like NADP-dependent oxidoreductase